MIAMFCAAATEHTIHTPALTSAAAATAAAASTTNISYQSQLAYWLCTMHAARRRSSSSEPVRLQHRGDPLNEANKLLWTADFIPDVAAALANDFGRTPYRA